MYFDRNIAAKGERNCLLGVKVESTDSACGCMGFGVGESVAVEEDGRSSSASQTSVTSIALGSAAL